ncbi:50S ribosomal protein L9 [Clostridium sp. WLY-B-L2]|uniref:Large ribosomal subunit protein bL9 n=1 Tax=Clostridium aromativorans TaxID=2836848 RepID=A0ABS8N630_9CLOT|nr:MULTISPECIES: 50S ribosomal protein L9 [Clostridium]KAA8673397.1 50S ribosomal protein L9 [Clostridium sp. HV4-5-A1G]MCC9295262.1 50S ribosomal protein L9 [Clostridium aromativorans]CAB1255481.1 ribosomal protein L9 [Clostridiaceae bacterium BL-3]
MKVILLKNVKSLGEKGEVVKTSDGYARNYLIPKGLAEEANDVNLHIWNNKKEAQRKQKISEIEAAQKLAENLKGKEIRLTVKSGENGRLFGSITGKDISDELKKKFNINVDKKKIVINNIRQLGVYFVEIKLYPEISTKIKVVIEEE